ncbi:MAG: DNA starvation/stationary phase protection protein Dps [Proteobacteria bacterium]|nr:DNA starvation/stationary phase protection protein Dps [Pseudomonadota bacterium]
MHKTRIDLAEKQRKKIVNLLAVRLADAIDLALQAKQAHWNVRGPQFIALHQLFDAVRGVVDGHVDELAERIAALGGTAEGTVQVVAKRSSLEAYPLAIKSGPEHVAALAGALATFGRLTREAIDGAEAAGDKVTADLFTEITGAIDQQLWLVEAHAQAGA